MPCTFSKRKAYVDCGKRVILETEAQVGMSSVIKGLAKVVKAFSEQLWVNNRRLSSFIF